MPLGWRHARTDYIDLLHLHAWDFTTPADEIMRAMDDLVRAGRVLPVAISDAPAWQVARMQTLAELRGWSPLIALPIEYGLLERTVERDPIPMAAGTGLGVVPWSPLGSGVLAGTYTRADLDAGDGGASPESTRRHVAAASGSLTARGPDIAAAVAKVAAELGTTPSRAAVAWTLRNPAVTAPIVGARTVAQLEDNLGALDVDLTDEQVAVLDAVSAVDLGFPDDFLARPDDPLRGTRRRRPGPLTPGPVSRS